MIDFESNTNDFLYSPFISDEISKNNLEKHLEELNLTGHVFIMSSGTTTNFLKGYALSKKAILANARAVNEHLALNMNDSWLCSLPHYHIGGLSIYARAHLSGAKVITFSEKWNVDTFMQALEDVQVVSVVPAQCFDLVCAKKSPPKTLKYLIVGGDYLNDSLHRDLINLGWPVIRTFGMTEVCSQLATEKAPSKNQLALEPLAIHKLSVASDKRLLIESDALFTGIFYIKDNEFHYDEVKTKHYLSSDLIQIENGHITPLGRLGSEVKIKGRRVDLFHLQNQFKEFLYTLELFDKIQLKTAQDTRDGLVFNIHSLIELEQDTRDKILNHLRPHSVKSFQVVKNLSKTELGKDKN